MASIGDLFFSAHLQDAGLVKEAEAAGDKAGQSLGSRLSSKLNGRLKGALAPITTGLGIGAGIAAFGGLTSAVDMVTSVIGDSIKAFNADQESISRLRASLKANIPAWDGNTTAIEGVLSARMKLGFSDEEQRTSLAGLVGATHDVTKALDIQRVAMDLARFKGISLADASEALTKVEAGSYRILKSLGIELKANATQQDALNAVRAIATGQAEDFANTNQGKVLVSQIKVNEAEEKFGKVMSELEAVILPLVADAITALANDWEVFVGVVTPAVGVLLDAFHALGGGVTQSLADVEKAAAAGNYAAQARLAGMRQAAHETSAVLAEELHRGTADTVAASRRLAKALPEAINDAGKRAELSLHTHISGLIAEIHRRRNDFTTAAQEVADATWDPQIVKAQIAVQRLALADKQHLKGLKSTHVDVRTQAQLDEAQGRKHLAELLAQQASFGIDQRKLVVAAGHQVRLVKQGQYLQQLADQGKFLHDNLAELRDHVAQGATLGKMMGDLYGKGVIAFLEKHKAGIAQAAADAVAGLNMTVTVGGHAGGPRKGKAGGGYVPPGWSGPVGEKGTEELVMYPGGGGYVIPHGPGVPSMNRPVPTAGITAPAPTNVVNNYYNTAHVEGLVKATSPLDIARELGRFARNGQFVPKAPRRTG
jgi:hypothetical protein